MIRIGGRHSAAWRRLPRGRRSTEGGDAMRGRLLPRMGPWAVLLILVALVQGWSRVGPAQTAGATVPEKLDPLARMSGPERPRFPRGEAPKEDQVGLSP